MMRNVELYQLRCDCCGKFVRPGEPGGSWVMVPGTDWNAEDERERCPACTEKHGQAHCGPGYVEHLCCGMNAMPNDRVEGRDAASSRRVPSHDGLEGNGTGRHE